MMQSTRGIYSGFTRHSANSSNHKNDVNRKIERTSPNCPILQTISVTVFNKTPLYQMLTDTEYKTITTADDKQLKLFE